jgi:hypothetical protein
MSRHRSSNVGSLLVCLLATGAVLAALSACSGSDDEAAFTPVAGTESAYCDTFRAWQVHELEGEGDDQPNPAAFKAYWKDYLEFNATARKQAPPEIRDEWVVSERGVRTILTPVLAKYGFDVQRLAREGTAREKALATPPPDVQKAQATIHAYEARVCGTEPPPAANVVFKADAASRPYCRALRTFNGELAKIESSRFEPDVMQTFVTSGAFGEQLDALDEAAPNEIAADQEAQSEWLRSRWSDVLAEFEYDIRRIWLDGTPEDRAVFHLFHPDVARHESRLTAYEEQVCGGSP